MKHILTILTILVTAITVQAQSKVSTTRQVVKTIVLPTPLAARQIIGLRVAGMEGMAASVELRCAQAMMTQQTPPLSTIPVISKVKDRPWLVQKQRDFKAWKLKRQRRQRDEQDRLDEQARQAREALEATLPQLNPAHAFETSSFEPLLTEDLPADPLPLLETPGVLYRGMALAADGNSLENILQNGLLIKDLGSHATTKLLAMSGGMRSTVSAVRPVTNLTSLPSEALYWSTQRIKSESGKKLSVIVGVDRQTQSGKAVLMSENIPASQLTDVIVPLQIAGTPVWCNVSLTSDQTFLVIPYDLPPLSQTSATGK